MTLSKIKLRQQGEELLISYKINRKLYHRPWTSVAKNLIVFVLPQSICTSLTLKLTKVKSKTSTELYNWLQVVGVWEDCVHLSKLTWGQIDMKQRSSRRIPSFQIRISQSSTAMRMQGTKLKRQAATFKGTSTQRRRVATSALYLARWNKGLSC